MKVWMFVYNSCRHDARVLKEAKTLAGMGLPVVSSNFPALKEVVEEYGLGCTFEPEEPESIAAAINAVLADKRRYDTMGRDVRAAARRFNQDTQSRMVPAIHRRLSE